MNKSKSDQTTIPLNSDSEPVRDRGDIPDYLKPKKTMQIAVSGGIPVTEIERQIIDTPDFQRLRSIRELGLAHLVYPTALHTRFDHSIGTLHMAAQMTRSIRDNPHNSLEERLMTDEQVALIRIYALVHDITHIPYGHTLEDELRLFTRHDENTDRIKHFLGPKSRIGSIIIDSFDKQFHDNLLSIYSWNGESSDRTFSSEEVFIHDVVSNTVCADLLDYLQRDNYFCNLGVTLVYHFIDFLYLSSDGVGQKRVFVRLWKDDRGGGRPRRDTLTDLCRLLETRYIVAERIYFHHAKIAASVMLGRAIQEAQSSSEIDEQKMRDLTDEILLAQLRDSKSGLAKKLAWEVTERRLYKELHTFSWLDVQKSQEKDHLTNQYHGVIQMRLGDASARREFENEIADVIKAQPGDVLIYAPTRKMNRKEANMNVFWEGEPQRLKDIKDQIVQPRLAATLDAHRLLWSIRLFARDTLTPEQRQLAIDMCEIELVSHAEEKIRRKPPLYVRVVENALAADDRTAPSSSVERKKAIDAVVEELVTGRHEPKPKAFSTVLRESLDAHFPKVTPPKDKP